MGVRQNSTPQARISIASQPRNSNVGMGNQAQRWRRMVTVGLYTARKPVVASSRICSAKATHRANHALPKPDAESAGDACLKGRLSRLFSIGGMELAIEIEQASVTATLVRNFAHERQEITFGVA